MTEQRLGILGGMGRPTRLTPCRDPDDLICSGQMNCPGIKVLTRASKRLDALTRGRAANMARFSQEEWQR